MENILGSEWAVVIAMMIHLLMAPGTKVEESFNVQALHDLIYNTFDYSEYDHHQFPGVVPRTFSGPVAIASVGIPARAILYLFDIPKYWMLFFVRFVLGAAVVVGFLNLARCVQKHFGYETAMFLRLIVATQFHFLFYASRTLPNIFALVAVLFVFQKWMDGKWQSAVRWATAVTFVYRCELALLFAPIFLPAILTGKLPLLGKNGAIFNGVTTALKALVITVPMDSFLWGRLVWPEGEVAWFNIFENRSHEYGVSPFLWYFYSALPRALMASLILLPIGLLLDRRLYAIVLPVLSFIFLYSFLPHKELRFIMYSFPLLDLPAAVVCARMYISRKKNWIRWALAWGVSAHLLANLLASGVFIYASARNYPGSDSLAYLQYTQRLDEHKHRSIYLDNYACQTGISRFLHLYKDWEYNKTENLPLSEMERFDFLIVGSPIGDLKEMVNANYTKTHRVMFAVPAFNGFKWRRLASFPWFFPEIRFKERIAVLKRRD